MAQNDIQITTTPPLAGLTLVENINDAFQSLATDFAGAIDPASLQGVGPYATWADTANGLLKRRNAAGTAWVSEGGLFSGLEGIASTAEARALVNDLKVLTPKKLADAMKGSNVSLSNNGYQKLPSGLIIQWGGTSSGASNPTVTTYPIAFPTACLQVVGVGYNGSATNHTIISITATTKINFSWAGFVGASGQAPVSATTGQVIAFWVAIGY